MLAIHDCLGSNPSYLVSFAEDCCNSVPESSWNLTSIHAWWSASQTFTVLLICWQFSTDLSWKYWNIPCHPWLQEVSHLHRFLSQTSWPCYTCSPSPRLCLRPADLKQHTWSRTFSTGKTMFNHLYIKKNTNPHEYGDTQLYCISEQLGLQGIDSDINK